TYDSAERYGYEFIDNFSGWKQITVNFPDMSRAEVYNRAPNDGLGLNEVHGWGFGTANKGQARYYLDDFELLGKPDPGVDGR
ncbi:MAG: carbohydrate binding domain-containing protein, partial [Gammaproteobacteria bacterium]